LITQEAREQRVKEALEAYVDDTNQERIPLPWQGSNESTFPVVKLRVDVVLLNPRSHRIKSQLESHPKGAQVADDPYSDESQAIVAEILKRTEGYEPLRTNLAEVGQRDAGVVTRSGLLVNANTRLVALREIDPHGYIRVAVLPKDADEKDIDQLELRLQIQRDFKQDYSFTNELLFINDLLEQYHYSQVDVAKALNWAASSDEKELRKGVARVQQNVRILALIRELQDRSGHKLPLTFFDLDKRQALIDLDDKYESLKKADPDGADRMREGRLLGILSGNYYRELRKIDPKAVDEHLAARLAEKNSLSNSLQQVTEPVSPPPVQDGEIGDLDLLDDEPSGEGTTAGPSLRALVDVIASTQDAETVELPTSDGGGVTKVEREDLLREVAEAVDEAAEDASAGARVRNSLDGPLKLVRDATKKLEDAIEAYREVHGSPDFQHARFQELLKPLETSYDAFRQEVAR
jgi:hypothetical protein